MLPHHITAHAYKIGVVSCAAWHRAPHANIILAAVYSTDKHSTIALSGLVQCCISTDCQCCISKDCLKTNYGYVGHGRRSLHIYYFFTLWNACTCSSCCYIATQWAVASLTLTDTHARHCTVVLTAGSLLHKLHAVRQCAYPPSRRILGLYLVTGFVTLPVVVLVPPGLVIPYRMLHCVCC